jgi:hypothetical protein
MVLRSQFQPSTRQEEYDLVHADHGEEATHGQEHVQDHEVDNFDCIGKCVNDRSC